MTVGWYGSVCIDMEEEEEEKEEEEGEAEEEEGWIGVGAIRLLSEGRVVLLVAVATLGAELIPDDDEVVPFTAEGTK